MTHDDAQQRRQAALLLAEAEHAAATVRAMLAAEPDLVGTEVLDTLQARADAARAACRRWDEPKVGSGVAMSLTGARGRRPGQDTPAPAAS